MKKIDLDAQRKRIDAAFIGPWRPHGELERGAITSGDYVILRETNGGALPTEANRTFIAAARTDLDLDEQALREAKRMAENHVSGTRHPPEVVEMAWRMWLAKWFGE